ncbi:unnamed protein product [Schistosoma rodhaini]|nr:unnamed protein product [Schistosoma rodhaini]
MLFSNLDKLIQFAMLIYTTDNFIRFVLISSFVTTNRLHLYENINHSSEYLKMNSFQRTDFKFSQKYEHIIGQRHHQQRSDIPTRLPSVQECISDQYNYSVTKGCLCHLFQSSGLSNGSFEFITNLHLNLSWNTTSNCIIYTFVGDLKEIVHVRLLEFSLPMKIRKTGSNKCTTQFKVYHQLERAELMNNDQPDYELCGQHLNQLPVHDFHSYGRVMIIELDEITKEKQKVIGFYEFLDRDAYQTDGLPIKATKCDQLFFSSSFITIQGDHNQQIWRRNNSLNQSHGEFFSSHTKTDGKFFSPNYPRFYKASILCKYYFLAHSNERIIIKLKNVQLWSYKSCHSTSQRDTIHFHEITTPLFDLNNSSFFQLEKIIQKPFVYELKKQLLFLCGDEEQTVIISDHRFIMLTLQTHVDSVGARGFEGVYQFLSKEKLSYNQGDHDEKDIHKHIDRELFPDPTIKGFMNTEIDSSVQKKTIQQINHIWMNPSKLQGTIKSPNYPSVYPQNCKLLYTINIPKKRFLRLKFSDIQLGSNLPSTKCTQLVGDRIEIYEQNYLNNTPKLILCGTSVPQEQIMLNNKFEMHRVYIYFITDHITSTNELGFMLSYEYSTRNDYTENNNKLFLIRKDLSDKIDDVNSVGDDTCQFTITSYGKESNGFLHIPNNLIRTRKPSELNNCKWKLEGGYGQRIQIRFVRRLDNSQQTHQFQRSQITSSEVNDLVSNYMSDFIQYNQEFGGSIYKQKHQPDIYDIQEIESSFLKDLKCPTSMALELINYRADVLTTNNDFSRLLDNRLNPKFVSQQSYKSLNLNAFSTIQSSSSPLFTTDPVKSTPLDPVRLCAGDFMTYSPASKGFMSGNIPRLDIVLKISQSRNGTNINNNIINSDNNNISMKQNFRSIQYSELGYDVQYKFVTDYGVIASSGNQRKPSCFFEFNHSQSITGNFSSPNYPGLYPIDIVCEYRFSGLNVRRIDIEFLEFDVESTSKTCSDDTMDDNVEISSCYPTDLLSTPKRRLCHKQNPVNPFRINWHQPCLNLRFFSNGMYVRTGFFGVYEFHDFGQQGKKVNKLLVIFLCFTVNSLLFLVK